MAQELLLFVPVYNIVGIYRLLADAKLRKPIWDKLKHGLTRGAVVGLVWGVATYRFQRAFVSIFLINTPRVTGLSHDNVFGYAVPVATYATVLFLSTQIQMILKFFVGKNLRIARDRAWDQTLASRGKAVDFWGPYVEEWERPPRVGTSTTRPKWERWITSGLGRMAIKRAILLPLNFLPVVGIIVSAGLKSLGTARFLHKPYFESKKMSKHEVALFMEERAWDYRLFGFTSALLESAPLIGIFFTISNRVGACMWAFDLEKRQHLFQAGALKPLPPRIVQVPSSLLDGPGSDKAETVELRPHHTSGIVPTSSGAEGSVKMAGAW